MREERRIIRMENPTNVENPSSEVRDDEPAPEALAREVVHTSSMGGLLNDDDDEAFAAGSFQFNLSGGGGDSKMESASFAKSNLLLNQSDNKNQLNTSMKPHDRDGFTKQGGTATTAAEAAADSDKVKRQSRRLTMSGDATKVAEAVKELKETEASKDAE